MVALVAVALIAIAFPLSGASASTEGSNSQPVLVVSDGLTSAIHSQAQTLVSALAQGTPVAAPREAFALSLEGYPGGALVPRPVLEAAAALMAQGALAGPAGQEPLSIELQEPVRFTLHEGSFQMAVFSTRPSVGAALTALGAEYTEHDIITPSLETPLTAGLHVFIERATPVSLSVGGAEAAEVLTHAETVADLLEEQGVELTGRDSVSPKKSTLIEEGLLVTVTFVGERTDVEETPIPFDTIYVDDAGIVAGAYVERQAGYDGFIRREYAAVYENGVLVSRELVSEVAVAPTDRIIAQGTGVVAAAVSAPSGDVQCAGTMTVWATWYTAASAGGYGYTATGTSVEKGTVAVDPSVIPLGTRLYVPGYGYAVAEDTGGAIVGNIIDLGYGPYDVWDWQSGYVEICILG